MELRQVENARSVHGLGMALCAGRGGGGKGVMDGDEGPGGGALKRGACGEGRSDAKLTMSRASFAHNQYSPANRITDDRSDDWETKLHCPSYRILPLSLSTLPSHCIIGQE